MLGSSHSTLGICTLLGATWRGQDALPPQQAKPGLAGDPGSRQPARRRRYDHFSAASEVVPSRKLDQARARCPPTPASQTRACRGPGLATAGETPALRELEAVILGNCVLRFGIQ